MKHHDWKELQCQVDAVGGDFHNAHASGHIHAAALRQLIIELNPKTAIPIHSLEPEKLKEHISMSVMAHDGEPISV